MPFLLSLQEEKIAALQSFADQLISADHYAKGVIATRRNEVLDRWVARLCFSTPADAAVRPERPSCLSQLGWTVRRRKMVGLSFLPGGVD